MTRISRPGIWISLDGTEGTGKSVLATHLQESLEGAIRVPEFSDSPIGQFLLQEVKTKPHFIGKSLVEQSLLFLADFFRIHDNIIYPALQQGRIVISDRGLLSKYVYQQTVLEAGFSEAKAKNTLDAIFKFIDPPDLSILLLCTENDQKARLMRRDGHCTDDRLKFIRQANTRFVELARRHVYNVRIIDQKDSLPLHTFLRDGLNIVNAFLER
jgi:dTMP kinase